MNKFIITLTVAFFSSEIYAYVGPGMGGGVIAAIIGFIAAFLIGFWGILYYPIKRALNRRKKNTKDPDSG